MAFFTAEELTQAGFDAEEVRIAFEREQYFPSIALDPELVWQYSPRRSRSSSHEHPRGRARLSEEYQQGYDAGHEHGVSGRGRARFSEEYRQGYAAGHEHGLGTRTSWLPYEHENAD